MLLAPFGSDRSEEHRRMVETNLIGAMTATEVFLEQLRDGGGDIVNVSSVAGRTAPADFAVYAATKWGHERLVGIAAPRATAQHPRHRHRARRRRDRTDKHITDADSKRAAQEATANTHVAPTDIAEVIAFAVSRPHHVALNEILVRPTAQAL